MKAFIFVALIWLQSYSDSNAWLSRSPCYYPDAPHIMAPYWICQQTGSSKLLTAVGFSERSSAGVSFTKSMATANARVKLAQRLKNRCGIRNVSDAMLINSRLLKTQRSPNGAQYVQLGIRPADLRLSCQ